MSLWLQSIPLLLVCFFRLKWSPSRADKAEVLSPLPERRGSGGVLEGRAGAPGKSPASSHLLLISQLNILLVVILIDGCMLAQECQDCKVVGAEQYKQRGARLLCVTWYNRRKRTDLDEAHKDRVSTS